MDDYDACNICTIIFNEENMNDFIVGSQSLKICESCKNDFNTNNKLLDNIIQTNNDLIAHYTRLNEILVKARYGILLLLCFRDKINIPKPVINMILMRCI